MRKRYPWEDSTKWKKGYWYPGLLSGDIEYLGKEGTIQGTHWDLYRLEDVEPGAWNESDIEGLGLDLDFYSAVKLANAMNPEQLWTASWIKDEYKRRDMVGGKL